MEARHFTIVGLLFDIAGVTFLAGNEVWARHKESVEDKLPADYYEKYYSATRDDKPERPNTKEEDEHERMTRTFPSRQALSLRLWVQV